MELITTAAAARTLGRHPRTVARLARDGRLTPAMQLPGLRGAYLFDPKTVAEFAASRGTA